MEKKKRNSVLKNRRRHQREVLPEVPIAKSINVGAHMLFRQGVWPNCSASVLTASHSVIRSGMMTPTFTYMENAAQQSYNRDRRGADEGLYLIRERCRSGHRPAAASVRRG